MYFYSYPYFKNPPSYLSLSIILLFFFILFFSASLLLSMKNTKDSFSIRKEGTLIVTTFIILFLSSSYLSLSLSLSFCDVCDNKCLSHLFVFPKQRDSQREGASVLVKHTQACSSLYTKTKSNGNGLFDRQFDTGDGTRYYTSALPHQKKQIKGNPLGTVFLVGVGGQTHL